DPTIAQENAHRPFDDVEDIVLFMRMRAGTLGMRLQPPFGDGIAACRFIAVGLEDGADASHRARRRRARPRWFRHATRAAESSSNAQPSCMRRRAGPKRDTYSDWSRASLHAYLVARGSNTLLSRGMSKLLASGGRRSSYSCRRVTNARQAAFLSLFTRA